MPPGEDSDPAGAYHFSHGRTYGDLAPLLRISGTFLRRITNHCWIAKYLLIYNERAAARKIAFARRA
jgi:hypothetical protein